MVLKTTTMKKLFIILVLLPLSCLTKAQSHGSLIFYTSYDSTYNLPGRSNLFPLSTITSKSISFIVVISITVDRSGKVINANYLTQGSTTNDSILINLAIKAADAAKFSKAKVAKQKGTLTIKFIPTS
jgi:hypothetical protein